MAAELEYLERRAAAESEMALRAKCPAAVKAHQQMSQAYSASAEALRQQRDAQASGRLG